MRRNTIIFGALIVSFFLTALAPAEDTSALYSHYLKGLLYFRNSQYQEALDEFNKVKRLDPKSSFIRFKVALSLIRLEKIEEAEKELIAAKKIDPDNLEALIALIFLYTYSKEEEKLEETYQDFLERAHSLSPENIRISEYLAQFYFYKKRFHEALKIYELIVAKNPEYLDGLYWLGTLHEYIGEREKAIEVWKNVLEQDPKHADALNSLGYTYAEQGVNLKEAKALIEQALEIAPENGAYLDSLGWVYFKQGDYGQAEQYLKKAIGYIADPVIYEHLGDLYIQLDNVEEALSNYRKGLEIEPDNETLKRKLGEHESTQ